MQPIAESDHGLCGNHKPNRFFRVEQKRKLGLAMQGLVFFRTDIVSFLFIIQPQPNRNVASDNDYLCCSAFKQEIHNYEINQRPRAILKKERFHLPFNTSTVLIDKLTP